MFHRVPSKARSLGKTLDHNPTRNTGRSTRIYRLFLSDSTHVPGLELFLTFLKTTVWKAKQAYCVYMQV